MRLPCFYSFLWLHRMLCHIVQLHEVQLRVDTHLYVHSAMDSIQLTVQYLVQQTRLAAAEDSQPINSNMDRGGGINRRLSKALMYWIGEAKTSIMELDCMGENCKGDVTKVAWPNENGVKDYYDAQILKIGTQGELKKQQVIINVALDKELLSSDSCHQSQSTPVRNVTKSGRKLALSKPLIEYAIGDDLSCLDDDFEIKKKFQKKNQEARIEAQKDLINELFKIPSSEVHVNISPKKSTNITETSRVINIALNCINPELQPQEQSLQESSDVCSSSSSCNIDMVETLRSELKEKNAIILDLERKLEEHNFTQNCSGVRISVPVLVTPSKIQFMESMLDFLKITPMKLSAHSDAETASNSSLSEDTLMPAIKGKKVELFPSTGAWISENALSIAILAANGKPKKLATELLKCFYNTEMLGFLSANGQRTNDGISTNVSNAIKLFVMHYFKSISPKRRLSDTDFNKLFYRKCGVARRSLKMKGSFSKKDYILNTAPFHLAAEEH